MGFEAPLALLGLIAAGVPVLAHLVRRRDLVVVELPTIALLQRAQAQSRRRMRLVDLLLLLCRILLVALLALAVAEPYVTVELAYGDGRVASVAVVVDDSMSMGRDEPPLTEEAVRRGVAAIEALPPGSEVAVVAAGSPARLLVPRTDDLEAAAETLSALRLRTARGTAMPEAIAIAGRELAGAHHEARRMLVLTDGAEHGGWQDVTWPEADVAIDVERVGPAEREPNLAVAQALAVPDPTAPGTTSVSVEVRGYGVPDREVRVALEREGEEVDAQTTELTGGVGRVTLRGPLITDGDAAAQVVIATEDVLPTDDRRAVLLRPPASLRVLLVDGDPHTSRDRDEVGYLARALELAPASEGAITYRTVDPDTLASQDLSDLDAVVLANVPAPPAHVAQRLRDFVEGGGGLWVTGGDNVDPRAWSARLEEVLPARPRPDGVVEPAVGVRRAEGAEVVPAGETGLENVQTHRRLLLEDPIGQGRVELVFTDGAPALVTGRFGSGRTALFATTLDDDWTDLPLRPGYLPLVVRMLRHLSPRATLPDAPVEPGVTVTLPPPPAATRMVVIDPAGERHEHDTDEPAEITDTDQAGAYRVQVATRASGLEHDVRSAFVVAPPAEESDLSVAELPHAGGTDEASGQAEGAMVERPIAPWLFALVGLFALLEGALRLYRPRARRGASFRRQS